MTSLYRQIFNKDFLDTHADMASRLESRRYVNLMSGVLAVFGLSLSIVFPLLISSPFMLILMLVYGEGSMGGGKLDKISEKITGDSIEKTTHNYKL